jgi:HlyD family secretion protein
MKPNTRLGMWIAVALLSACSDAPQTHAPKENTALMRVSVERIAPSTKADVVTVQGQIVARQSLRIVPELEGLRVQSVLVEEGARVRAGQVLVELSAISVEAELLQARANLARAHAAHLAAVASARQAEVQEQRAQAELDRYREVIAIGAVSLEDADQRKAALAAAQQNRLAAEQNADAQAAELSALQASLSLAEQRNQRLQIRAPVAGVLSDKRVEVGSVSSLGAEPYFVLHPHGARDFAAELDLATLALLRTQSQVQVQAQQQSWRATLRTESSSDVVRSADQRSTVRFALANSDALSIGQAASASIETPAQATLRVPLAAVQFDPSPWVYVLDKNDQAQKRTIELASNLAQAETLNVRAGLVEGDRVIAKAANLIVPGQKVAPILLTNEPADIKPAAGTSAETTAAPKPAEASI